MKQFIIAIFCLALFNTGFGQTFFKTPSGARYHLSNCSMVKNVSQEISADEARKLGLTPCMLCHPADIYAGSVPVVHKAKGEGESVQCMGITKAGTRCRHQTKIGNGYCFQHQP